LSNIPMFIFKHSDYSLPNLHSDSSWAFNIPMSLHQTFSPTPPGQQTEQHSDLFDSSWKSQRRYDIPIFGFCRCIEVSEDSSADRKTKLTLMLTEPRNIPIVF